MESVRRRKEKDRKNGNKGGQAKMESGKEEEKRGRLDMKEIVGCMFVANSLLFRI